LKVSIVIPCYNAQKWLHETLLSAESQRSEEYDLEIIVVDDGSIDQSVEIIKQKFPDVVLIQTPNQGASRARNTGTAVAVGEFIQYLDADDLLAPQKIAKQLDILEKTGADVAYGDWLRLKEDKNGIYHTDEIVSREIKGQPEIELFTDFWCPPAVYLYRRSIIESFDGWNERLPIIQDARFALDCALHGADFVYCSDIMASYRDHIGNSLSKRNPIAFVRDILNNTVEVHEWWMQHGNLTEKHKLALIQGYAHVARSSFESDRATFTRAYTALKALAPNYKPQYPPHLRIASQLFGYPNAEFVAMWYHRLVISFRNQLSGNTKGFSLIIKKLKY
jgi:glycosyltransferase involved in cell wall biosynthesis